VRFDVIDSPNALHTALRDPCLTHHRPAVQRPSFAGGLYAFSRRVRTLSDGNDCLRPRPSASSRLARRREAAARLVHRQPTQPKLPGDLALCQTLDPPPHDFGLLPLAHWDRGYTPSPLRPLPLSPIQLQTKHVLRLAATSPLPRPTQRDHENGSSTNLPNAKFAQPLEFKVLAYATVSLAARYHACVMSLSCTRRTVPNW